MIADIAIALNPFMLLNSSMWNQMNVKRLSLLFVLIEIVLVAYYLLCLIGISDLLPMSFFGSIGMSAIFCQAIVFMSSLAMRLYDVRAVMKSGNVWSNVCLSVETIYSVSALSVFVIFQFISFRSGSYSGAHTCITVVLLGMELIALGLRIFFESAFVIMHKHERIIIESMKLSQMEVMNSNSRMNELYKDVYERVTQYFEAEKPFLNSELTINDIVKVVFTNKLYISRAISHYTGRNFCQFVNYHRVIHSMDVFRNQPDLKVSELANICGFNSVVSFSTAFRLFMGETPSEWCRKERSSILKKKK